MKRLFFCALCAILSLGLHAEGEVTEGHWTQVGGGYWWTSANWKDGQIPGVYLADDGSGNAVTNGTRGGTAYFDTDVYSWRSIAAGTFDGGQDQYKLLSISNLVFQGDAFTTMGANIYFPFYLEEGGGVYVRENCTKPPLFNAGVGIYENNHLTPLTLQNDAEGKTLTFNADFLLKQQPAKWGTISLRYGGRGVISVAGAQPGYNLCRFNTRLFFTEPGKLILTGTFKNTVSVQTEAGTGAQTIEIAEGASCNIDPVGANDPDCVIARTDLTFTGDGALCQRKYNDGSDMRLQVYSNCTLSIACATFKTEYADVGWILDGSAGGTMKITATNLFSGAATIRGGAIFDAQALGLAGEASPLGLGSQINLSGSGVLRYTGSGETTDRTITVSGIGVIEQAGTGTPDFSGSLVGASTATLVLSNETSVAARYSGALKTETGAPKIRKVGSGEWILGADVAEAGEIEIVEGTLTIENPAMTLARVTVGSAATLVLGGDTPPETRPDSLTVYGTGRVKAKWSTSLPTDGITTPNGAQVTAQFPPWTWQNVIDWANVHPIGDGWSALSVDVTEQGAHSLENADVTGDGFALCRVGTADLNVNVTDAIAKNVSLIAKEGTLKVTGAGTLSLGKALVTSTDSAQTTGKIVFDNLAGGVRMNEGNLIVGSATTDVMGGVGEVVITNTAVTRASETVGAVKVGQYGKGLLKIDGTSSMNVVLGAGYGDSKSSVPGEGTIWQTAGTVVATNGVALGGLGTGCYRISGGKLVNPENGRYFGGSSGQGMLVQTGGEVEYPAETPDWAVFFGYNGAFVGYQTGGKLIVRSKRVYFSKGGTAHSSYYTVAGSDAMTELENTFYMGEGQRTTADGPLKTILNLNEGGTFKSAGIGYYPTSTSEWKRAYVNFNGGKLVTTVSSPLGGTPGSYPTRPDRVTIFGGGAELSVPTGWDAYLPIALSAPFGDSVLTVPVPDAIADREFGAPPHIEIFDTEGTGDGASAFAELDMSTRKISQIVVTSPGWGYTTAVARFSIGLTSLATVDCTLGPVSGGGFIKSGLGALALNVTNSYAGATIVREGKLKLGVPGALPTNTTVCVKTGATLDLNGFEPTIGSIQVDEGGAVANGSLVLPGLTFDVANPQTVTCDCAVTFAADAKITLQNVDQLDPTVETYWIARFTGDVTNMPTVVQGLTPAVASKWHVSVRAKSVRLMRDRGFTIILR